MKCRFCEKGDLVDSQAGWYCSRCIKGVTLLVLGPGVGLQKDRGELVGVLYGGQLEHLDMEALLASAREWFASWPDKIARLKVVVEGAAPESELGALRVPQVLH